MFLSAALLSTIIGCNAPAAPAPAAESPATATPALPHTTAAVADPPAAPSPPAPRAPRNGDWFEDVTRRSGVDFTYRNGIESGLRCMLETLGGGVAMLDYDRDGDLDLFFTGGGVIEPDPPSCTGLPCALYRNDGDWKFADVTAAAGLADAGLFTHGASVGDLNRDHYPDLCVTGFGGCRIYQNQCDGRFQDITAASGVDFADWGTACCWADVDRDGWPDLFIAGYCRWTFDMHEFCGDPRTGVNDVCSPSRYEPAPDRLYRNLGDGTFEDISARAGLKEEGRGLGVVAADLNGDGWIDLYVANDQDANQLYAGSPQATFEETALTSGVALSENGRAEGSMGVDLADYDGDGLPDLWVTNFEAEFNALYKNRGDLQFSHESVRTGLAAPSATLVKFGAGWADFDLDGWEDLFLANGHIQYELGIGPYLQPAQLFRSQQGQRFAQESERGGPYFSVPHAGRGAAAGDLDDDGAIDLVFVHQNERVALLRNRLKPVDWLRVKLQGTTSEPLAAGARVIANYRNRRLSRWVKGGGGYLSHSDMRILLPAEGDGHATVEVEWLGGARESFQNLSPGKTHELIEGTGRRL